MKQIIFLLWALFFDQLAQSQTLVRLGLNFLFRNPELTSIRNCMKQISGSGTQICRQFTHACFIWSFVELQGSVWNFFYTDSIFLKTEYETELYKFFAKRLWITIT